MVNVLHLVYKMGRYRYALPVVLFGCIVQGILIVLYLPEFLSYSHGAKNPDQLFWYNTEYIEQLYAVLGEAGRRYYISMLQVDFLYTSVAGIGYSLLMSALLQRKSWFVLLPLLVSVADIGENIALTVLLKFFPEVPLPIVYFSSCCSAAKMGLGMVCIGLLFFYGLRSGIIWIKKKRTTHTTSV